MAHIFALLTCTRVRWPEGSEDYIDEHGWIDRSWSPYVLHDSRNDGRPEVDCDENDPELADYVREALGWLGGGYEDNEDGTFYSADSYMPAHDNPEGWSYSYALHFVRKTAPHEHGGTHPLDWRETEWHPVNDGGIEL